ncbi:uncharacterized protein FIESC28_07793 [Fusarium coffeatum]|uniref:Uncharacterized protein n=1 Tax=Fusarium coffeatum TaxID=231269 RepID=A0A366RB39_9HYPO|nr:uncharacterized protein FIESC28_07793 [Fusarium coffeatum]RBR14363.1 hypothetical protein FIESC28_07793 [Fusarium coffeatum]
MYRPAQTASPYIPHILKSIRQRDSRAAHIHRQVAELGAPEGEDYLSGVIQILEQYVPHQNLVPALTYFNIHRFSFIHPIDWEAEAFTSPLHIRENLQNFIEFLDNVNQLATAFAGVPDPEHHWSMMYCRARKMIPLGALMTGAERCESLRFFEMIRNGLQVSANRNPPGGSPTDIAGKPINSDFFALVQREFLMYEFETRANRLSYLYREGFLPKNEEVENLVRSYVDEPHQIYIRPFKWLVKRQRLFITSQRAIVNLDREKGGFDFIINDDDFFALGVQGLAASLPKRGDYYGKQLLFQLNSVNYQLETDLVNYGSGSREAWCDGWFGRYSGVGPSAHVSLDDKYLSANEEDPNWHVQLFKWKHEPVTVARELGLLTAVERVRLWGPAVEAFSCDVLWETFAWLDDCQRKPAIFGTQP